MTAQNSNKKPKPLPSQELLLELLEYFPETGLLYWRERGIHHFSDGYFTSVTNMNQWNTRLSGKEAFTANHNSGYKHGRVFDKPYQAHRVIWKMVNNSEPEQIDHINHDRSDNRIVNLRASCDADNSKNRSKYSRNKSGFTGVSWSKKSKKWQASIKANGKAVHLGLFTDKKDAIAARQAANIKYNFHENHGNPSSIIRKQGCDTKPRR